jgi:hypothetical protein
MFGWWQRGGDEYRDHLNMVNFKMKGESYINNDYSYSYSGKRGMVLLMVLAVLTLLCLLGLMFVMMANVERSTARAYLDMVRTKLIAQSGIHAAMVNTRTLLTAQGFDIKELEYRGEDLNGDGGITVGLENYEDQDGDHQLQISDCPLYRAVHPSFMVDMNHDGVLDAQDLINVQGKWVGVCGIMPGPYNQKMDAYYSLKVEDLSGKIFINGTADPFEKQVLKRVLDTLTTELWDRPLGQSMVDNAPYSTMDELKTKLGLTDQEFTLLANCVTTYAWRDTGVIKPVPIGVRATEFPPRAGDNVFTWRSIRPLMIEYPTQSIYGRQQIIGRAPVNVNTASQPVLTALLAGLAGLYLNEVAYFQPVGHYDILRIYYDKFSPNPQQRGSLGIWSYTAEITIKQAREIARAIIQNRQTTPDINHLWRGSFRSWQQFGLFCDKVLVEGQDHNIPSGFLTSQQADVLKANFNPNSNLPEFNPPAQRLFWVGKDNLWSIKPDRYGMLRPTPGYSTEFSFFPTGYFLITSLGRLLGTGNKIMSEAEVQAAVQLFSLYRETSQKDFLDDFWSSRKAPITEIISTNPEPDLQPTTSNLTLQTYPEIMEYDAYAGSGNCRGPDLSQSAHLQNPYVQDAHYDGYITLATVENRETSPAPDFRASYNNRLDADIAAHPACLLDEANPDTRGPYKNRLVGPASIVTSFSEQNSLRKRPGTLFPDGVYSERDGILMYDYRPADLDSFAVSMWIKPHFFPEAASKNRVFLTYQIVGNGYNPLVDVFPFGIYSMVNNVEGGWNCPTGYDYGPAYDNASFIACGGGTHGGSGSWGSSEIEGSGPWGGGIITPCLNHIGTLPGTSATHNHPVSEGEKYLTAFGRDYPTIFKAGQWLHLAWVHQTGLEDPTPSTGLQFDVLWVNGTKCDGLLSDIIYHNFSNINTNYYTSDNILRLGEKTSAPYLNSAPDATLDEVCIWEGSRLNLTAPGQHTGNAPNVMIDHIWKQGRYYRGNDGVFTSRAIDLCQQAGLPTGTPMTVFMMAWTQFVPEQRWTQFGDRQGIWHLLPQPGQVGAPTCEIEIWDKNKKARIGVRKSTTPQPDPAGELIKDTYSNGELVVTDPVRYRVKFLPNVNPLNDILIDPLIFDDITIIYYSVPKFLSWAYRR